MKTHADYNERRDQDVGIIEEIVSLATDGGESGEGDGEQEDECYDACREHCAGPGAACLGLSEGLSRVQDVEGGALGWGGCSGPLAPEGL